MDTKITALSRLKRRNWKRFAKFSIVGSINVVLDFSILNLLSLASGINKGFFAAIFSAISFIAANYNSYQLNKKWTFRENSAGSNYGAFLKISIIGVAINSSIVYVLTSFIDQDVFSDILWLNVSKFGATLFVAVLNYFCYKKFVFKNNC